MFNVKCRINQPHICCIDDLDVMVTKIFIAEVAGSFPAGGGYCDLALYITFV